MCFPQKNEVESNYALNLATWNLSNAHPGNMLDEALQYSSVLCLAADGEYCWWSWNWYILVQSDESSLPGVRDGVPFCTPNCARRVEAGTKQVR